MSGPGDASGSSGEDSPEERWVTYDELGRIRGIGRESAVKLAQRKKWRRIPGNDDRARILVPLDWLVASKEPPEAPSPEHSPETFRDADRISGAFETALAAVREAKDDEIAMLKEALASSVTLIDGFRADRNAEREERLRAEATLARERDRIEELLTRLTAAEMDAKAANERAWASGETAGALREQMAALERRFEAERGRADRAEGQATHERQDFLDAENRTRQELDLIRKRAEQAEAAKAAAEREADQLRAETRQADAVRRARGLIGRLLAVWRSE